MGLKIRFTPKGMKQRLNDFKGLTLKDVDAAMSKAALIIRGTAKRNIERGSRSGKVYRKKIGKSSRNRKILHRASARGEFPKSDSGRLAGSIDTSLGKFLKKSIGSNLEYAEYLELGTSRMDERPWLRRSGELAKPKIQSTILIMLRRRAARNNLS